MSRFDSLVEKKIREAMEQGEFDDLPGRGRPLDLKENPFEDPELRMVHHLLRNAGFAPAWIEERKDIDTELQSAREILLRAKQLYGTDDDNVHWGRAVREFRARFDELNQRITVYNLRVPGAAFQCKHLDAEAEIQRCLATRTDCGAM